MTVQELIELLSKVEDKTQVVKIAVHTQTKVYPVAYTDPMNEDYLFYVHGEVRIQTWLPEGMSVSQRKK